VKITATLISVLLVLVALSVAACETNEERLSKEARAEATKFWETRVFRKCGGDYFGKREGKVYQLHGQYVIAFEVKTGPGDPTGVFEWCGRTIIGGYRWRTFDSGAWSQWQEDKIVSPGLTPDEGRKALLSKAPQGQWTFMYVENSPNAYRPVECNEIETLQP
jgi:hypothetical protein